MTTNMAPNKLLDEAIALVNEKFQLKVEIIELREALDIEKRHTSRLEALCTRSRSPRRTPKTDTLEHEARDLFRDVLLAHYIDGHDCGKDVDQWLRKHKGWFPDNQEIYGDGTPLTQPKDDGMNVASPHTDVLEEAHYILEKLHAMADNDEEHILLKRKKLRSIWSSSDPVGR